ncbi:hypothetical protein BN1013_01375 [Candidatus Rubidus massiliensis]|nr:hypothetical protein BN1013_01375 [Candidatus Rubidus massiliensis]
MFQDAFVQHKPIVQEEYLTYKRYIKDIALIETCLENQQVGSITFNGKKFTKVESENTSIEDFIQKFANELSERLTFLNTIHSQLKQKNLTILSADDCSGLIAKIYNKNIDKLKKWNQFEQFSPIVLIIDDQPLIYTIPNKSCHFQEDERALNQYFDLIKKYPETMLGTTQEELKDLPSYEIIRDRDEIEKVRKTIYKSLYSNACQTMKAEEAHEYAMKASRVGVVLEDRFWYVIRDAVKTITWNKEKNCSQENCFTYNRLIWKNTIGQNVGGAAVLPIIKDEKGEIKILLQLCHRHAVRSFQLEICRGGALTGEKAIATAERELKEEHGAISTKITIVETGMNIDTGLTSAKAALAISEVQTIGESDPEVSEVIIGKYAVPYKTVLKAIDEGKLNLKVSGKQVTVECKDPFLQNAIFRAQREGLLPRE